MKTNVRQHKRHTKNKVADVTEHTRRIKDRQVVAVIPVKDLRYRQAKAIFPRLNPNGDIDGDGVKNKKDCRPFDAMRQDDDAQDLIDEVDNESWREKNWVDLNKEEMDKAFKENDERMEQERIRDWGISQNRKTREGFD
jgi:hypothetical protein